MKKVVTFGVTYRQKNIFLSIQKKTEYPIYPNSFQNSVLLMCLNIFMSNCPVY